MTAMMYEIHFKTHIDEKLVLSPFVVAKSDPLIRIKMKPHL